MTQKTNNNLSAQRRALLTRRKFLELCGACLIVSSTAGYEFDQLTSIQVSSYTLPLKKSLLQPFRIVHLSDVHNSYFIDRDEQGSHLTDLTAAQNPDVICITGDLVDKRSPHPEKALLLLQSLSNICPVLYVSGNHEKQLMRSHAQLMKNFYDQIKEIPQLIQLDSTPDPYTASPSVKIYGVEDPLYVGKGRWIDEVTKLSEQCNNSDISILLSHRPERVKHYGAFDVTLCGHTHGGQLRIPFLGALWAPNQGFFPRYAAGHFKQLYRGKKTDDTKQEALSTDSYPPGQQTADPAKPDDSADRSSHMIVSRGIGCSVIPIRTQNHPEIVSIELISAD